jgi:putative transcriptional regulator
MTRLGEFLDRRAVNRSMLARRTGLNKTRIHELTNNEAAHLRARELYLIALALDVEPGELLKFVFEGVKLKKNRQE